MPRWKCELGRVFLQERRPFVCNCAFGSQRITRCVRAFAAVPRRAEGAFCLDRRRRAEKALESQADSLGLSSQIHFLDGGPACLTLGGMDVFCSVQTSMASTLRDEAMPPLACRGTAVGGVPALLESGQARTCW